VLFWDITGAVPRPLPPRSLEMEREQLTRFKPTDFVVEEDGHFRLLGMSLDAHLLLDVSAPVTPERITQGVILRGVNTKTEVSLSVSADGRIVGSLAREGHLLVFDRQLHEIRLDVNLLSALGAR